MRRISLCLLLCVVATNAFAREEYHRNFDRTLTLQSGERVLLEHKFGDITIRTHSTQDLIIHADIRVSASNGTEAKEFADRVEILIEPSAELSIRTFYPERPNSFLGFHNVSFSAHYEITMPENSPLIVRNSFGAVSVTGLKADSELTTSHGELVVRDGRGTQRLENSFARVEITNNAGNVTVENSNGDVEARGVTGSLTARDRFAKLVIDHVSSGLNITNSNGAVEISDSGGFAEIKNSFGDVTVRGCRGDLTVNNANAKVEASDVDGSANLKTTFGEVRFANVGRQLTIRAKNSKIGGSKVGGSLAVVNSFGSVDVSDIGRDVRIESGNGAVSIAKVGGSATITTSFGMVDARSIRGSLSVTNTNGGVKASNMQGAQVKTSFAAVLLEGVSGPIDVQNQNGAVEVSAAGRNSCEPIAIRTSFSDLRVHLQPEPSYRVSARTSFGKISTDLPINTSGSISNDDLNGVIGAGRCELRLVNNNGSIEILKSGS